MEPVMREKLPDTSRDVVAVQIEKLKAIFPEAVVEGRVDFDKLRATLGDAAESGPGRFSFTWAGKDDAIQLLQTPSRATLVPCPDESINFDTTSNVFIEGDNLEVLKLLFKPYFGRVKLIYIDPPYNTGQDFVYPDNYADPLQTYLQLTGQSDQEGNLLTSNPETSGRYHSAWLSMMYPRLFLARQLLRDDGVIFVSIDDHEFHHLRILMNEVFGEENFVTSIVRGTGQTTGQDSEGFGTSFDYVLVYAREAEEFRVVGLPLSENDLARFTGQDERGRYCTWQMRKTGSNDRREDRPKLFYPVTAPDGTEVLPIGPGGYESNWRFNSETYAKLVSENMIEWKQTKKDGSTVWWPYVKQYLEGSSKRPSALWTDLDGSKKATIEMRALFNERVFDNPKPVGMMKRIVEFATDKEEQSLVLDFFAGSCTFAQAVLELNHTDGGNRQFIVVQVPERTEGAYSSIAEIGKERLRRCIVPLTSATTGTIKYGPSEDLGFKVFKLAPPNIQRWNPAQNGGDATSASSLGGGCLMTRWCRIGSWKTSSGRSPSARA